MNVAGLRAGLTKNKTPLAIGGVVVVGLLAWRARSQAASGATPAAGTIVTSGTTPVSAYSSGAQTYTAGGGYSSAASDAYNALQPTLEQILNNQTKTPIPVPATPTVTPDLGQGYFRRAGQSAVYQLHNNGTLEWVSAPAYKALGTPQVTDLTPGNQLWSAPVVGPDAPAGQK